MNLYGQVIRTVYNHGTMKKKEVWRPIIIWNINEIGSLKIKPEKLINKTEKTFSLIGCAIKTKMEVWQSDSDYSQESFLKGDEW